MQIKLTSVVSLASLVYFVGRISISFDNINRIRFHLEKDELNLSVPRSGELACMYVQVVVAIHCFPG